MHKTILIVFLLLIAGCSTDNIIENDNTQITVPTPTSAYEVLTGKFNDLESRYDILIQENQELEKKNYFSLSSLSILNKCRDTGTSISAPRKDLDIKTICNNNCTYYLNCGHDSSMLPYFECKDRLTAYGNIEKDEIETCDIIGFTSPQTDGERYNFIIHQVVNITEEGYRTKGTGNDKADDSIVNYDDILFKVIGIEYGPKWDWQANPYWK